MIAARATLAMAVHERVLKAWPDVGAMLVADVHFRRPVAGFQVLTLANLILNSHGSGDEDTALDSLKVVAADIVRIIVNRHVRVLTGDFGRGLFSLVHLIRGSGVGLEVVAWRPGTDGLDGQPFVDSCVVCLVGPATKVKLKTPSLDPTSMNTPRSSSSRPLADFTRGSGGLSRTVGAKYVDTWLAGVGAAQKTTTWPEMPACIEKTCPHVHPHRDAGQRCDGPADGLHGDALSALGGNSPEM